MERRRFSRLAANVLVTWKRFDRVIGHTNDKKDTSRNISRGGICVVTTQTLRAGDTLHLDISLPDGRTIVSSGKVMWSKPVGLMGIRGQEYEVGVQFLRMDDEDKSAIEKFVLGYD